jgi:NAD(P)-dependent dehydrogenase (short-subunit alcohol dehydrogenase family)
VLNNFLPVDAAGLRVLVTAGAAGIGRVIASAFTARGARVAVCDVDEAALAGFRAAQPEALALRADVADEAQVEAMFAAVRQQLGGLDVLVNNAGIAGPTAGIEQVTREALDRTLAVDVVGMFLCAARATPLLRQAGGGSIINLGSVASRLGFPLRTPYSAAKWGVIGFTQSLAIELGPAGIRVNAILPGHVEGERFASVVHAKAEAAGCSDAEMRRVMLDAVALKRTVAPEDIANMTLFLASPFGASVSGQALSVCGGVLMMR